MKNILFLTLTLISFTLSANDQDFQKVKIQKKINNACVKGLSANVRSEADTKASIVTNLSKYTPLTILEEKEDWTKVQSKNFIGWIFNELIIKNINCVMVIQPGKAFADSDTSSTHSNRENVNLNEAFKILSTEIGVTQVQDKYGNVFWIENQNLWPKTNLENLSLSL
tara:strand:- start:23907 stop:24410 length:504 start_codon:yes stop_codon:yes gene_type:complete